MVTGCHAVPFRLRRRYLQISLSWWQQAATQAFPQILAHRMQAIVHGQRGTTEAGGAKDQEQDLSGTPWKLQTYGSTVIQMDLQNMIWLWF